MLTCGRFELFEWSCNEGWREIRGVRTMIQTEESQGRNLMDDPTQWETVAEWYLDVEGKQEKDRRQVCWQA